jgi:ADP-heptose:LPS heptosyltransferase
VEIPRAKLVVEGPVQRPAQPFGVIHAVAATPEKTWRADGFLAVAEYLKRSGIEPVFIGASSDNLEAFREYRRVHGAPLAEIKKLLSGASLFIGNDSGPAHMAAAFGVPVVEIFRTSDAAIWGPWRTAAEVVTAPGGVSGVSGEDTAQVLEALGRLGVHA